MQKNCIFYFYSLIKISTILNLFSVIILWKYYNIKRVGYGSMNKIRCLSGNTLKTIALISMVIYAIAFLLQNI